MGKIECVVRNLIAAWHSRTSPKKVEMADADEFREVIRDMHRELDEMGERTRKLNTALEELLKD